MPDTQEPPLYFEDTDEMARKTSLILREVLAGKTNNTLLLTLKANSETTEIERDRVSCDTLVALTPKTPSAATAMASGTIWFVTTNGRITIHHDSQPDTDRTFGATLIG